jgi:hypothetical protein
MPDNPQHPAGVEPPVPRTRLFWICYEATDEDEPAAEPDSQEPAAQESIQDAHRILTDGQDNTQQPPALEPPAEPQAMAPEPSAEAIIHPPAQVCGHPDRSDPPQLPEAMAQDEETPPTPSHGRRGRSRNVGQSPTSRGRPAAGRKRVRRSLPRLQQHEPENTDP